MKTLLVSCVVSAIAALGFNPTGVQAQTPSNPILFVTIVPNAADSATQCATFGNHLTGIRNAPRGGDLWIRYPDGSLRNLTKEAGFGTEGIQAENSIAVREPSVHFDGKRALFSMVVGAPTSKDDNTVFLWQLYEITGLGKGETVRITKVPNQPSSNNISPCYGSDGRIIFVSDNRRLGSGNTYEYLDENLAMATNSGLWSLNPQDGNLKHLDHSPSGDFNPSVDSYGRVMFTRWDILQQDLNLNTTASRRQTVVPLSFANELPDNANTATQTFSQEQFPELNTSSGTGEVPYHSPPRDTTPDPLLSGNNPMLDARLPDNFFPWAINQDGSNAQTVNHIGRHDLARAIPVGTQSTGSPLVNFIPDEKNRKNQNPVFNLFNIKEDPRNPGVYYAVDGTTVLNHSAGQIVRFQNVKPTDQSDEVTVDYITHRSTRTLTPPNIQASPNHSGFYRTPVPTSDGMLLASHTANTKTDAVPVRAEITPTTLYSFRLRMINTSGGNNNAVPGVFLLQSPITKNIVNRDFTFTPPRSYTTTTALWEMDPVEVVARATPAPRVSTIDPIELSVFADENVDVKNFTSFLEKKNQAVVVSRDITMRDAHDRQQPFNLRVDGTNKQTVNATGPVSVVSDVRFFQADYRRGYKVQNGGVMATNARRVLPTPMHDVMNRQYSANLGKNTPRSSTVKIENDGSWAAFVPSSRALSWQLTDPQGAAVVRERYWLNFKAGEIRACVKCHGDNQEASVFSQPVPTNKPVALRNLLRVWKEDNYPSRIRQTLPVDRTTDVTFPLRLEWLKDNLALQYEVIVKV
ncbi:MAG: hypothetical protein JNL32_09485, partial [Candidatus Kapabacteria bacterium]|nr:hypothetical protein [Candidatus Kapabacteria bacterium]